MLLTMQAIDGSGFSDRRWQQFHQFLADMSSRELGNVPPASWQGLRDRLNRRFALQDGFHEWILLLDDDVVGWLSVDIRPVGEGEAAEVPCTAFPTYNYVSELEVNPVALCAGPVVARTMRVHDCPELHCMATEIHLDALRQAWNGRILSRLTKYRLDRREANRHLIERWLEEFPVRFPSLRLDIFTEIPDAHVDRWIALFGQSIEDMPNEGSAGAPFSMGRDEVRRFEALRRENSQWMYTAALFDSDDNMVGHSNVSTINNPPTELHQAITVIERAWRGQGLSKWLKAALFVRTGLDFPESRCLVTEMRAVNEPIMAVNRAMGYKLISEGYEWSITREELVRLRATRGTE